MRVGCFAVCGVGLGMAVGLVFISYPNADADADAGRPDTLERKMKRKPRKSMETSISCNQPALVQHFVSKSTTMRKETDRYQTGPGWDLYRDSLLSVATLPSCIYC